MAEKKAKKSTAPSAKINQLKDCTEQDGQYAMTTNQGVKISDDQNSLKAGTRGATLMEDFIFREKMTHFDHERIPERIVHARGSGAHGFFELYKPIPELSAAAFLNNTQPTPVFVRFSTVAGSRGSTDLARDVRGFAVKFYTTEGNFDLVGNNMPVFFIQDAIKFPDLIHAVKPEPDNEMPQAASAHNTFWDFISLMPESAHMVMWLMSDRAIPRSYRMMEGFGVHTFRLINADGNAHFVKFHWKPLLGVHAVAWDEAQKISGKDPDFHRRDLWDAIDKGVFPEWELGIQIVPEADEHRFDFDLLDPTKIIPEELVPVQRIGKMILNKNPDNFFAETEQVAFHIGNVVPGIDFTNDPLLQGRLFSYTDTQLIRLGGPNFHEIPINRPLNGVHNNQRDGFMRQQINKGKVSYHPNSIGGGCPFQTGRMQGGFTSYAEKIDGNKIRERSDSFRDHFSQATLFYQSQSDVEQQHIADAFSFELGKVTITEIRQRMINILGLVDKKLAASVAINLGLHVQTPEKPINHSIPADGYPENYEPIIKPGMQKTSPALSMINSPRDTIKSRKIAILLANGVDAASVMTVEDVLKRAGAFSERVAPQHGKVIAADDTVLEVHQSLLTASSVLYDAVYVAGGIQCGATLAGEPDAVHFLNEAYRHCKAIAIDKSAIGAAEPSSFFKKIPPDSKIETVLQDGLIAEANPAKLAKLFVRAIAQHRFWEREPYRKVPA